MDVKCNYRVVEGISDPIDYFAALSDSGEKGSILLESADIIEKYGEQSIGSANPCIMVKSIDKEFEISALNKLGRGFLEFLEGKLGFCKEIERGRGVIKGVIGREVKGTDEESRLKSLTQMDVLRTLSFSFKAGVKGAPATPYGGLFGAFSYDFIDQFENLPEVDKRVPDLVFYFVDNLFIINHRKNRTTFIANRLPFEENDERCLKLLDNYEREFGRVKKFEGEGVSSKIKGYDISREDFIGVVKRMKKHVEAGDVFQAVPSRNIELEFEGSPLEVYKKLKAINPSPYMFYFNFGDVLLGASPEMCLRVQGESEKVVEIRPIAGTKPRGFVNGRIDADLDSRYEAELKLDEKELAEHTMLIDLARNDVARVSREGTRVVNEPYIVEKYSHVQHLVSNVRGFLRDDLDALHAYLASMNMGTLTGAPKIEAMKLLRMYEKSARGFYGGAMGYLTPSGDFDSCIVIRSIYISGNKASVRSGAGIVYDSIPEREYEEVENKGRACLNALGVKNECAVH